MTRSIRKIWLICLWIASLTLVGCFHIPDEDWLPSKNKVKTWKVVDNEMEQAFDSLVQWFGMISSQREELESQEIVELENFDDEIVDEESIDTELEDWTVEVDEGNINVENQNQEMNDEIVDSENEATVLE